MRARREPFPRAGAAALAWLAAWAPSALAPGGVRAEEPTGPGHTVSLAEETRAGALFQEASAARERAQYNPKVWEQVAATYGQLFQKFSDTVYLERWEGPALKDWEWRNGLYKSTFVRLKTELAQWPPLARDVYRALWDRAAEEPYRAARRNGDLLEMRRVAAQWYGTTSGRDALFWLAEMHYQQGAYALAGRAYQELSAYPGAPPAVAAGAALRLVMTRVRQGDRARAEEAWRDLRARCGEGPAGEVRLAHATGHAALNDLWNQVQRVPPPAPAVRPGPPLATFFGDARHHAPHPRRIAPGKRLWSLPLLPLLYGPRSRLSNLGFTMQTEGEKIEMPRIPAWPVAQDGHFYLCTLWFGATYPIRGPLTGGLEDQGNGRFFEPPWPEAHPPARSEPANWSGAEVNLSAEQHPYFVTLGPEHVYLIGSDRETENTKTVLNDLNWKPRPPAYLYAVRRPRRGEPAARTEPVWALKPDAPAFARQAAEDQEWLRETYWTCAPTCEDGVLYGVAADLGTGNSLHAAAVRASDGRLLWRTPLFSTPRQLLDGPVRPAQGVPPAVAGGLVFVLPNQGALAALDASDGELRYIRVYDRIAADFFRTPPDLWRPHPPIRYEGWLLAAPQDSEFAYAFDAATGKTVWQLPRKRDGEPAGLGGLQHLLGVTLGQVVLSGRRLHWADVQTGRATLPPADLGSPIRGRGLIAGDQVWIPTEKELVCVQMYRREGGCAAEVLERRRWTDPAREAGNLFLAPEALLSVTLTHINAYEWTEP